MNGSRVSAQLRASPLFILGLPRSGTTLLSALLDGHPQLLVAPHESHFFTEFLPQAQGKARQERIELLQQTVLRHLFDSSDYHQRYLAAVDRDAVRLALEQQPLESDRDGLSSAIVAYGLASGQLGSQSRYWVEKTPGNERFVAQIYQMWPAARCIHVLRDPRALLDSYRARRARFSISAVAYAWRRSASLLLDNRRRYGAAYLFVRYEDLATSLEPTMARIAAFLAIDDDEALRHATKTGGRYLWKGNSAHAATFNGEISRQSVDRWQERLSESEVWRIERLLADPMRACGYESVATGGNRLLGLTDWGAVWSRRMRDRFL